ncbi:MAG: Crp/Fnr family transcriptional regulator [Janthinobacterium lividum]
MSVQPLLTYFDSYLALNNEERAQLGRRVVERWLKRRQFVLQQGDVCRHYTFVVAGCLKLYSVDEKGTEHMLQFAAENDWINDIGSFHAEQPSQFYLEAIEPAVVLQLEKPNLLYLYRHYPKFNLNFRVIIENKFVELQQRVLQNISSPAEERYRSFLSQYPGLATRLPNTQIAAYIGITPEF